MENPSDDLRQWLPVTYPPTMELPPEDAEGGFVRAVREALKDEIGAAWDDFADRSFTELAAMEKYMGRRVEALGEERERTSVPPEDPGPNRFADHMSEEQWASFCERDRRVKMRKRREALATRGQVKFRLDVLRNVLHRRTVFGDESSSWGEVPPEGKEEMATAPGRPSTAEANPEQIRDVLAVVLDFASSYDPEGAHVPFRKVKEAVAQRTCLSPSGAESAVLRAAGHLRSEYGADVPKPNCTVAYYAEHSAALREALDAFESERLSQ